MWYYRSKPIFFNDGEELLNTAYSVSEVRSLWCKIINSLTEEERRVVFRGLNSPSKECILYYACRRLRFFRQQLAQNYITSPSDDMYQKKLNFIGTSYSVYIPKYLVDVVPGSGSVYAELSCPSKSFVDCNHVGGTIFIKLHR